MRAIKQDQYISEELCELLKKHTSLKDVSSVETETNVSSSIILKIKNGTSKVSERSMTAVIKLIEIAYVNAEVSEIEAKKGKKSLKVFLDCI
jgi:hypothetical protein